MRHLRKEARCIGSQLMPQNRRCRALLHVGYEATSALIALIASRSTSQRPTRSQPSVRFYAKPQTQKRIVMSMDWIYFRIGLDIQNSKVDPIRALAGLIWTGFGALVITLVMTVGYYRLPNWAYCENGLEHQNTAPFSDQFPPPFGQHSKILNSVRASNLT